jgi:GST-like protein
MPAIIDHDPVDHGEPVTVFESGAILLYLAEKTGLFIPTDMRGRKTTTEWLFWQMGGLGPMAGQNHHFGVYAPEKIPYAINRYVNETNRLYGVIDHRLADRPFLVGDAYTITDMAAYPWIVPWKTTTAEPGRLRESPSLVRRHRSASGNEASLCKGRAVFRAARSDRRGQEAPVRPDRGQRRQELTRQGKVRRRGLVSGVG